MSMKLKSSGIQFNVPDVSSFPTENLEDNLVCVVTDENQGGTFVYRSAESGVNNGGTNFNGWIRQYSGAVNVKWFGAKGDGVTDDTASIQAALNVGGDILIPVGIYMYTSSLIIYDNTTIICSGTLSKNFTGLGVKNEHAFDNTQDNYNIKLLGLNLVQHTNTSRGISLSLCNVINVLVRDISITHQSPYDGITGSWGMLLSGKNIDVENPNIDTTVDSIGGGEWNDGIHCFYVEDLNINGGSIYSGDDCIGLFPHYEDGGGQTKNLPSKNINISDIILGSNFSRCIAIGAISYTDGREENINNIVYKNVKISNITQADVSKYNGIIFGISDKRLAEDINDIHNDIFISDIVFKYQSGTDTTNLVIDLDGNPDYTDSTYYNQYNVGLVKLTNITLDMDYDDDYVKISGIDTFIGEDLTIKRNTSTTTKEIFEVYSSRVFRLKNSFIKCLDSYSSRGASDFILKYVKYIDIDNTQIVSQGGYRTLNIKSNTLQETYVKVNSSQIIESQRGISDTTAEATTLDRLYVINTLFDNCALDIESNALSATDLLVKKSSELASGDGTTGGSGSAGAGNQYVELEVNGVKYKVLHDGTV